MIPVLMDTREQRGWALDPSRFTIERATLRTGDYTIRGLEDRFVLERKSIGDFVGTVIGDWIRFRKELYRLAAFDSAAIIVEADLNDVFAHRYESEAAPESVIGRANAIYLDHGIPVLWWGAKSCCVRMVENLFAMAVKKLGVVNHAADAVANEAGPPAKAQEAAHAVLPRPAGANQDPRSIPRTARHGGQVHVPA